MHTTGPSSPTGVPGTAAAPSDAAARLSVRRAWTAVRVDELRTDGAHGAGEGARCVVRACVCLGTLLPADVHVELLGAHHDGRSWRRRQLGARLWPAQSLHNDSFVFETTAATDECAALVAVGVRVTRTGGAAAMLRPVDCWTLVRPRRDERALWPDLEQLEVGQ